MSVLLITHPKKEQMPQIYKLVKWTLKDGTIKSKKQTHIKGIPIAEYNKQYNKTKRTTKNKGKTRTTITPQIIQKIIFFRDNKKMSYDKVARELDISRMTARKYYLKYLEEKKKENLRTQF